MKRTVSRREFLLLGLILVLAAILRFFHLGHWDLWFDEAYSAIIAMNPQYYDSIKVNPCLFEHMLHFWMMFSGPEEFAMRTLPALLSLCCIGAVFCLARMLFDTRAALCSALLMAVSPLHIYYAQELRSYSLFCLLSVLLAYCFVMVIRRGPVIYRWLLVGLGLVGVYTHIMFWFFLAGFFVYVAVFRRLRRHFAHLCIWLGLTALGFLPWLLARLPKLAGWAYNSWIPVPSLFRIRRLLEALCSGFAVDRMIADIMLALFAVLIAFAALHYWRKKKHEVGMCVILIVAPVFLAFCASQFSSVFTVRNFIFVLPFFIILIGAGLSALLPARRVIAVVTVVILSGISLVPYYAGHYDAMPFLYSGVFLKKPIHPMARFICENYKNGDIIAHGADAVRMPFLWYSNLELIKKELDKGNGYFVSCEQEKSMWKRHYQLALPCKMNAAWHLLSSGDYVKEKSWGKRLFINLAGDRLMEEFADKRIWFIASEWDRDGYFNENSKMVLAVLLRNRELIVQRNNNGVSVNLFSAIKDSHKNTKSRK